MALVLEKEKEKALDIKNRIIQYPHPILSTVASKIENFSELKETYLGMVDFVRNPDSHACGIALPQIGISLTGFVARVVLVRKGKKQILTEVFSNPTINVTKWSVEEKIEGCLSLEGKKYKVRRPASLNIRYRDIDGRQRFETLRGFSAEVVHHEIQHLLGITLEEHGTLVEE